MPTGPSPALSTFFRRRRPAGAGPSPAVRGLFTRARPAPSGGGAGPLPALLGLFGGLTKAKPGAGGGTPDPWLPTGGVPLGMDSVPVQVCRYDADKETGSPYTLMDNIVCVSITHRLECKPASATLRYRFTGDPSAPQSMEEVIGNAAGSKILRPNERIVVRARRRSDGKWIPLFDGFTLATRGNCGPKSDQAHVSCAGVAVRCFDVPIPGANWRQGDKPRDPSQDVRTEAVAHFNPSGKGNCVPGDDGLSGGLFDHDAWGPAGAPDEKRFPTFLDATNKGTGPSNTRPTSWTLPGAVRYLQRDNNDDEEFVKNTPGFVLDDVLVSREPIVGKKFNALDPATYTKARIKVADKPVTGRDWPGVMWELLNDKGFAARWLLTASDDDIPRPQTAVSVFDPRMKAPKDLWLQARGSNLDLALSNVCKVDLTSDIAQVVNRWDVEGELEEFECSLVLSPGFPSQASDAATDADISKYDASKLATGSAADRDAYRTWIFDECGEGHYAPASTAVLHTPGNLDDIFGAPLGMDGLVAGDGTGRPQYVRRRRVPADKLLSLGADGQPLEHRLWISKDYAGDPGKPWDGSGTWQLVVGGYKLLKDRIGIRITVTNPNHWNVGPAGDSTAPYADGICRAVEAIAKPTAREPKFSLRLTCVLKSDDRCRGSADRKLDSVVEQTVARKVQASDRYRFQTVSKSSELAALTGPGGTRADSVTRDDTPFAQAEAYARQLATQHAALHGALTVPHVTDYYQLGDPIRSVQGRRLSLRSDNSGDTQSAVYPIVTEVEYRFEPRQETCLTIDDAAQSRRRLHREAGTGSTHGAR